MHFVDLCDSRPFKGFPVARGRGWLRIIGSHHLEHSVGPFCLIRGSTLIYSVSRFSFHFVLLASLLALLRIFHVCVFQKSQIAGFHLPFTGRQGCELDRRLTAGSPRAGTVGGFDGTYHT